MTDEVNTVDAEEFEVVKFELLEVLRHELSGWDIEPTLLRKAFMAAVAELVDDNFGGKQAAGGAA
jgi:hypothetical protein